MKGSDKAVVLGVVMAVVLGAFYFMVLSPKRDEASKLKQDNAKLQSQIEEQKQVAAFAEDARQHFASYYGRLVVLGKAVPAGADTASLLVQLNSVAGHADVPGALGRVRRLLGRRRPDHPHPDHGDLHHGDHHQHHADDPGANHRDPGRGHGGDGCEPAPGCFGRRRRAADDALRPHLRGEVLRCRGLPQGGRLPGESARREWAGCRQRQAADGRRILSLA
jgi:hypothetical protein